MGGVMIKRKLANRSRAGNEDNPINVQDVTIRKGEWDKQNVYGY
jgi:hypothetical protein